MDRTSEPYFAKIPQRPRFFENLRLVGVALSEKASLTLRLARLLGNFQSARALPVPGGLRREEKTTSGIGTDVSASSYDFATLLPSSRIFLSPIYIRSHTTSTVSYHGFSAPLPPIRALDDAPTANSHYPSVGDWTLRTEEECQHLCLPIGTGRTRFTGWHDTTNALDARFETLKLATWDKIRSGLKRDWHKDIQSFGTVWQVGGVRGKDFVGTLLNS